MYAYCWASGVIQFGSRTPQGALPIARSRRHRALREFVEAMARHAHDGVTLLVPGVPEAADQAAGVDALGAFLEWAAKKPPEGVLVFSRAHRWPIDGRGRLR